MSSMMQSGYGMHVCVPSYWRLERMPGTRERYLIVLRCMEGHIHHAETTRTYYGAKAAMRDWIAREYWPDFPAPVLADAVRGKLILQEGAVELPLAEEYE